jgi:cyclohexanone monooxygenase
MGYIPELKYSFGPEILAYSQAIARRYGLYDEACFQTEVTGMRWDEEARRWIISTNRGDRMRARFAITASGPLNRPKLPGIDGIESFRGHTFHTSRWDYAYTGGSTDGEGALERLADKRVGIIGTGATAIQCVPYLGASAQHLYVFQRTPSSVDERRNSRTDPAWAASLTAGWQRRRMENFAILVAGGHQDEDLVNDGWTDITRMAVFLGRADGADAVDMMTASELADFAKMELLRARVDAIVEDAHTAEVLKPWYRVFCKRPCFNDDYLDTFNRPNVTLVDTDGQGVDRITETGVVVGDTTYELDCLIFATGFEVGTTYIRRAGFDVVGRDGLKLSEKWSNGLRTFHGFHSSGFPNLFHLGVTQTGITVNVSYMLTEQSEHIAYIVRRCLQGGFDMVEATSQAEDDWVATIQRLSPNNQKFLAECTPGYFNNEGRPGSPHSLQAGQYGLGAQAFFDLLRDWRQEGSLDGLVLTPVAAPAD